MEIVFGAIQGPTRHQAAGQRHHAHRLRRGPQRERAAGHRQRAVGQQGAVDSQRQRSGIHRRAAAIGVERLNRHQAVGVLRQRRGTRENCGYHAREHFVGSASQGSARQESAAQRQDSHRLRSCSQRQGTAGQCHRAGRQQRVIDRQRERARIHGCATAVRVERLDGHHIRGHLCEGRTASKYGRHRTAAQAVCRTKQRPAVEQASRQRHLTHDL